MQPVTCSLHKKNSTQTHYVCLFHESKQGNWALSQWSASRHSGQVTMMCSSPKIHASFHFTRCWVGRCCYEQGQGTVALCCFETSETACICRPNCRSIRVSPRISKCSPFLSISHQAGIFLFVTNRTSGVLSGTSGHEARTQVSAKWSQTQFLILFISVINQLDAQNFCFLQ